jgi:hypothetical protein
LTLPSNESQDKIETTTYPLTKQLCDTNDDSLPFFAQNDPIVQERDDPQTVDVDEENILRTLTRHNFTKSMMHGAQLLHGSASASLLAFTEYGQQQGLQPSGNLGKKGKVSFCGSYDAGYFGINRTALSTVVIERLRNVLFLYTYKKEWTPDIGRKNIKDHWKSLKSLINSLKKTHPQDEQTYDDTISHLKNSDFDGAIQEAKKSETHSSPSLVLQYIACIKIENQRLAEWEKLSALEQDLVTDSFPVLYGIKSMRQNVHQKVNSCIGGEVGLTGGANPEEVKVIFVPQSRLEYVRKLMENNDQHIAIEPFPEIPKDHIYKEVDVTAFR